MIIQLTNISVLYFFFFLMICASSTDILELLEFQVYNWLIQFYNQSEEEKTYQSTYFTFFFHKKTPNFDFFFFTFF